MTRIISLYLMVILLILFINCGKTQPSAPIYDESTGLPEDILEILKEILETNDLENSVINRNSLMVYPSYVYEDTTKAVLKHIMFRSNITILPQSVSELKDLECIEFLGTTERERLPEGLEFISHFNNLNRINIFYRTVDSSFNSILFNLSLETLFILNSRFNDFPENIYNITSLRELSLGRDSINEIKSEIGQLENLETLYLYGNQLDYLPITMNNLYSLTDFDVGENNFTVFPIDITYFQNLKALDISNNNISKLPDELCNLNKLLPDTVYKPDTKEHKPYYNLRLSENKICDVTDEIDSFLVKYAGENWKETQECE